MTTRSALALLLIVCLGGSGCEDSFSPKVTLARGPILYCVIQVSARQEYYTVTATLSRVYDVEGIDPSVNATDPTIVGATVYLNTPQGARKLDETIIPRSPGDRYKTPWHVYTASRVGIRTQTSLQISARLPDGQELSAATAVPPYKPLTIFPLYPRGVTTQLPPLYFGSAWIISWDDFRHEDHLFFPKLQLVYEAPSPSGPTRLMRAVPLRFVQQGDRHVPVYPQVTTARELAFDFAAIDATMAAISEGDQDKSRYRVLAFVFDLVEFDFPLSRYYSSLNGSLDQLSIRLEESVFTNISGGHGVFGTSTANSTEYAIDADYAGSFGYSGGAP